jgi:threonine/homoserine/homoserine lactone efflux protein
MVPSFIHVELSIYFFEQFIEIFFLNPKLLLWLLGLSLGISFIYFLFCIMLLETTLGGWVTRLAIVDNKKGRPLSRFQSILMALGAYAGVWCLLIGPLAAFWFDKNYRGWSEKLAGTVFIKKRSPIS